MKQFLLILLLLPICSFEQNVEILVSDLDTNEPLPLANICFKSSDIAASTNMEGLVSFEQSDLKVADSIVVFYISYKKLLTFYSKKNVTNPIQIKRTSKTQSLPEVVVNYEKPQMPEKIIKTAIRNTAKKHSNRPIIDQSVYRENNLSYSEIIMFTDMNSECIGSATGKEWIKTIC